MSLPDTVLISCWVKGYSANKLPVCDTDVAAARETALWYFRWQRRHATITLADIAHAELPSKLAALREAIEAEQSLDL